jgi:16S rRNA C967 or C1407 C5-methylase (RsmB/RsmF family)/NOL1/NOP2/fmu family ribosome biogenesis protein
MLPEQFLNQMKSLLDSDFESFLAAMEAPAVKGLRINRKKGAEELVTEELGDLLIKLPYGDGCYKISDSADGLGNTPLHRGGAFYIQDPGAMAAVAAAAHVIKPGMRAADLCAAPGGKTTQLSALLGDGGFLLANEFVPKRAKILVGNIERLGIENTVVTSLDTAELKDTYPRFFHFVLADAPCSGEGMFRKGEIAKEEWSEANVEACSIRQKEILDNAADMVADGGYLLYSTRTYNTRENEEQIDAFLTRHPSFSLIPVSEDILGSTACGVTPQGAASRTLVLCRRFYPHISDGEGQFIALMKKSGELNVNDYPQPKAAKGERTQPVPPVVYDFLKENLADLPEGTVKMHGDNAVLHLHGYGLPSHGVFLSGILLGEVKGKILFPSYQLFSALGDRFIRRLELTYKDAIRYLKGEELECADAKLRGFAAITYRGTTLGGGKISDGKVKNHYPKGLRIMG